MLGATAAAAADGKAEPGRSGLQQAARAGRKARRRGRDACSPTVQGIPLAPFERAQPVQGDPEREAKARELWGRAEAWCRDNPDAWMFIQSRALREALAKRRVSISWLVGEARRIDFADVRGNRTRIVNDINPCLARMIASEHPEARRFIVTKPSVADEVEHV